MKSTDLTREQVDAILAKVLPALNYLSRLSDRMDATGMATDPLAVDVQNAHRAMQALRMSLHYLNCDGVGVRVKRG
jgi:hypothetical protein